MTFSRRIRSLANELRQRSVPALLLTHLPDIRYLTGFTGSSAVLVVLATPRMTARLFTDGRYTVQARQEVQGATVRIATKSALTEASVYVAERAPRCGFDSTVTTVAHLASMKKAAVVKGSFFSACDGAVTGLRTLKDAEEQTVMRQAAALTCDLYEGLLGWIEPGMRELDVAAELEHQARLAGASGMSFDTIVASGERSSQPHAHATEARIAPGDLVTLDFGIVLNGYCSDMTRTFALGYGEKAAPPKKRQQWSYQRDVFEAVLSAQQAAIAAVAPGVSTGQVDRAARSVLEAAGLGKYFTHSTGHGVGLEIHESPRVGKDGKDVLEAGTVITIEPGVYLPGSFGVRIEDPVLVTEDGVEVLTPVHKGWMEL